METTTQARSSEGRGAENRFKLLGSGTARREARPPEVSGATSVVECKSDERGASETEKKELVRAAAGAAGVQ